MRLAWGPFHLPGVFGVIVNSTAIVYVIIMLFFSFWPPSTPATPATMNYSVLVFGTVILFSILYYFLYAKKLYRGPFMEVAIGVQNDLDGTAPKNTNGVLKGVGGTNALY